MAPTIKDSPESSSKAGLSPRANPVCLEVSVTLRSLPGESGGLAQPVREECKTVIVFDNGAVLRSTANLPAGQKVVLSNAAGRDVVCRVASGHNLPSIKGYAEVEFLEAVSDFWSIHTDSAPVSGTVPPPALSVLRPAAAPPPPPIRATPSLDSPSAASVSLGKGPSFEDIPDLVTTSTTVTPREAKPAPAKPALNTAAKGATEYSHSEISDPTSLANWDAPQSGLRADVQAIPLIGEPTPRAARAAAPTHDFLSQGLMAYEKPGSSGGALEGRGPLLLGLAAVVLVGVGAVVFVMHRNAGAGPMANKSANSQPSAAAAPATPPAGQPLEEAAREAGSAAAQAQAPAQPPAIEQDLPLPSFTPLPAVAKGPATADANAEPRNESRNAKRLEKSTAAAKQQPEPAAAARPAIPNLKMATPSAPTQNLANAGDAGAPVTEIAAEESTGAVPSANLLTAAGRTATPPPAPAAAFPSANPPPPAAAFKNMRAAQLISSTRPVYPTAAKETGAQGTVTVSASIDATGKVVSATAVSGPVLLRQAAADSVKLWKYSPALVDGKPSPTQVTVNVEFRLN